MAKLTQFENPFSGKKGSIFDISSIWSNILGVFVLFFVFAMGQRFANFVTGKVPAVDTKIEPIISQPVASPAVPKRYL